MPHVLVRPLDLTDDPTAAAVHRVGRAAYAVEAALIGFDGIPALRESVDEMRERPLHWIGAVAPDGAIAGFLAWEDAEDGGVCVDRLCVDPAWFRRGIASLLCARIPAGRPSPSPPAPRTRPPWPCTDVSASCAARTSSPSRGCGWLRSPAILLPGLPRTVDIQKCEWFITHMNTERRRQLSSAEERRDTVLRTAIGAFASRGYFGTTTTEVAKAAGISQSYVYRLFPNKEALFTAVVDHCFTRVRASLEEGAANAGGSAPEAVLSAMGDAYAHLIADKDLLLVLTHAQAAAVSEAAVRDAVRAGYARLVEYVRGASGGSEPEVQRFFAIGMLCHLLVSMDTQAVDAPWTRTLSAGVRHY